MVFGRRHSKAATVAIMSGWRFVDIGSVRWMDRPCIMNRLVRVVVEGSRYLHLVMPGNFGIERRRWFVLIHRSGRWLMFGWSGLWVLIMRSRRWHHVDMAI